MSIDYRLFRALNGLVTHGHWIRIVVRFYAGKGALIFPAALVLLWLSPGRGGHRVRTGVLAAAVATLLALGADQLINHLWRRPRPYAHHHVHLLLARSHDPSFPSDHAAAAFAIAVAVCIVRPRIGGVLAVLAAALGIARVMAGMHYPGDVAGGAAVGTGCALIVWWAGRRPLGFVTSWMERAYEFVLRPVRRLVPRRA